METSSLGRVFDAVAAMLGLGSYNHFDAQLPMALEAAVSVGVNESYEFEIINTTGNVHYINFDRMFRGIVSDIKNSLDAGIISAKFHNTIAEAMLKLAMLTRQQTGINITALSGGVFCNRYLINRLIELLEQAGFTVLFNRLVPSNDGGISLGQAAIAAHILNHK